MNKKTVLLLAGAGVLYFLFIFGKSVAAKNLKISFQKITFGKFKGFSIPDIFLNFQVINPSGSGLLINSIVGDVFINGSLFSTVSQTVPITIPANNTQYIVVKMQTALTDAVSTILNLIRNNKRITVTFKGVVNSTGYMIPIEQTVIQM